MDQVLFQAYYIYYNNSPNIHSKLVRVIIILILQMKNWSTEEKRNLPKGHTSK